MILIDHVKLQAVDHPYLVVYSHTAARRGENLLDADTDNSEQVCGICHDAAEDPVVSFLSCLCCITCILLLLFRLSNPP